MRKVFERSGQFLDEQLSYIRKNEIRINKQNEKAITQLGSITQQKKKLASELRSLISKVKDLDYEAKEVQSQVEAMQNDYDYKMQDLGGKRHISKVKEALSELMSEVQKWRINEGLMINAIFDFKKNEKGQNHIWDDVD